MGVATGRHFTNDRRVLHRANRSACPGGRMLAGFLLTLLVPPGAPIGLGADETMARQGGRKLPATGGSREAVRATQKHGMRGVGLKWGARMLLVPVPWSRRVRALPFLPARCGPSKPRGPRQPKTRVDGSGS